MKHQRGILITMLISLVLWLVMFLMVSSCSPRLTAIIPEGKVLERDGSRYLIIWKDMGDKPHSYAYNWVYLPELEAAAIEELEAVIVIRKKGGKDEY